MTDSFDQTKTTGAAFPKQCFIACPAEQTAKPRAPVIARCVSCGREYIALGSRRDMIDHRPRADIRVPYRPGARRPECGGRIEMVQEISP